MDEFEIEIDGATLTGVEAGDGLGGDLGPHQQGGRVGDAGDDGRAAEQGARVGGELGDHGHK